MGGCRCSYKNCVRATKNSEKDFHFFHYPVRDPDRCLKWIANARKPNFYRLPEDQLRNKVICQNHFEQHYFTNANRKRLIYNAVPTLDADCSDDKDESMCNVQVLQSDADGSVFTVDTNSMNLNEVTEIQSFLIENGDVVPADLTQDVVVHVHEPHATHETEDVNESNTKNDCKIEDICENVQRSELSIKNEPECIKEVEFCDTSVVVAENRRNGIISLTTDSLAVERKRPAIKVAVKQIPKNRSSDIDRLSKAVEEHSKEISRLKRLLNLRIQKVKLKRQKQKMHILGKLRSMLPPTLLSLINVHVFGKQDNFTKDEKHLLTVLFKASPSMYENLVNDYKWKLPNGTVVKNLIANGNAVR